MIEKERFKTVHGGRKQKHRRFSLILENGRLVLFRSFPKQTARFPRRADDRVPSFFLGTRAVELGEIMSENGRSR